MKHKNQLYAAAMMGAFILIGGTSVRAEDSDLRQEIQDLRKRLSEIEKGSSKPAPIPAAIAPAQKIPFNFADFTWLNGNSRVSKPLVDNDIFTGQFMLDTNYVYSYNHPKDHTLDGSCEVSRTNEVQVQQLGIGGDLHYEHIRGRVMTQFGMYSQMTPRNDASPSRGQWNLGNAYQYLSEANAGYHWDTMYGINLDAGIFMSYVGLFSYYNNENWAYQPSYVSANTPWFFNGLRLQIFPTETLKIEPWLVNGWQSYGMFNGAPGVGMQILWRPTGWLSVLSNNYEGYDTLGVNNRLRIHTDNSITLKYYDRPNSLVDKAAFSLTLDAGCEDGGGVSCNGGKKGPVQQFLGFMLYDRTWFAHDKVGLTLGGGAITNPGRYLALVPPINGATASQNGGGYFTQNPGDQFKAWDYSVTLDYMPNQYITWRSEFNHRAADEAYFAGPGGMTPPGGNQGGAGSLVPGFTPDLRRSENRITLAMLVRI